MTKVPIYDVVIVGAGPVGLATAIGLQKRGLENILVIDKTREFRQVGQGFDLLPNGLKALKRIDPDAYLEDTWCLSRGISRLFEQGYEEDLEKINEVFDEYEKTRYPIMAQVQQATLRGLYQTDQEWQDYNQRIHGRSLS
ncbi:MAG: FAD-dependent oxidoreductase [Roseofilum sp. SBFL]|nr:MULTISPECIES: FAD-dependent oxidoreductase [unclassified Roseofilum]MBP0015767.1 FAD-dependent oxidoreductase [Roseofilum sp. SID3]MBP0025594.1 FAD-dependent oxidoreductase [Roseofilum sp. SID2]MBP0037693.1 FAD-dependent oxidoreductase [Roseofilum sp. SID1]MBP0041001.1 FAD-dependent oxidoreductase [Roseofilum sp. SBFL]